MGLRQASTIFRRLTPLVAMIAATAAVMIATPGALGAEASYHCPNYPESCTKANGPNQNYIDFNESTNYSGYGVCALLWEYLGGSSYKLIERHCTPNPETEYHTFVVRYCPHINGHGETEHYYNYNYNLAGRQVWICE